MVQRIENESSLRQELDYYKRRIDQLAGENIRLDIAVSGLRQELKQKRQGFALLSELQQSIGLHKEIQSIFEITIRAINATLGMDRTVVLMPTDEEDCYQPTLWLGFRQHEVDEFSTMSIRFPSEFSNGSGVLLVNKSSEATPFIQQIRDLFDLSYFICLPVLVENVPIGLLLSGRLKEASPFYPPLDQGDVDTFQAISGLISASIRNLRLAVFKEVDRLKNEFFANISHEFRTPVTLTLGPIEQILRGNYGDLSDEAREQLLVVQRNQWRLTDLINQVLDLSKLEAGRMPLKAAPMRDFNRLLEEWIASFLPAAEEGGIQLNVTLDPEVEAANLFIDMEKFDILLLNLLSNAFKFTEKGSVTVSTKIAEKTFNLYVKDTGIGIKQDQLPHIFDRFWQAEGDETVKNAGTGIGLALVKEIAELHGGNVTVESHFGKGCSFLVSIPLGSSHLAPSSIVEFTEEDLKTSTGLIKAAYIHAADTGRKDAEQANQETKSAFDEQKSTILYIEDNPDLRNHVRNLLFFNYNVYLAVDGTDGLLKAAKYKPDLIITDQMMPGMSGRDLLQAIRNDEELRLIPVIFLTARAGTESRIECLEAGADDYLIKPFDEEELFVRIRNLLRARAQEKELDLLNRELKIKANELETSNEQLQEKNTILEQAECALQEANERLELRVEERTMELKDALAEVEELKNRLQEENIYLQQEIKLTHNFDEIITQDINFKKILGQVEQVAPTDATVLILGETGTGKELLARAVHSNSTRNKHPLVKVDCGALPANLIESELFGHEKGAFTGAITRKLGRFEISDEGTLFLDEIGDLPIELQVKLLRVLQDGEFERLGSTKTIKVDARVIAATNRDLEEAVEKGKFREDLFYRLNVFPIKCPPLRERREDIPLLVNHFLERYCNKTGKETMVVSQKTMGSLKTYHWPGNIRELENIIERAVIISQGNQLELGQWRSKTATISDTYHIMTLEEQDRNHIKKVLELTGWRVRGKRGAAELLGLKPTTLEAKMKKLNIERKK